MSISKYNLQGFPESPIGVLVEPPAGPADWRSAAVAVVG